MVGVSGSWLMKVNRSTISQLRANIQYHIIMPTEHRDWYDTPLYYDIIFDGDTDREADFLMAAYHRHASAPGPHPAVLEPACGSGRLMKALHARGCRVDGFDLSEAMVSYTKKRLGDTGRVWQDRMESFTSQLGRPYDFAHCLVSTFKYLLTGEQAKAHLRHVAKNLRQGGIYALGVHLTDYDQTKLEHERWQGRRGAVQVTCNTRTWPADRVKRLEAVRTRLRITRGAKSHVQETNWQFRTYNASQLRTLILSVPELEHVASYDFTHDIDSPRKLDDSYSDIVVVLRRR